MNCPACNSAFSNVHTTRKIAGSRIRRYRTCHHCGKGFSTTEMVNPPKKKREDNDNLYILEDDEGNYE